MRAQREEGRCCCVSHVLGGSLVPAPGREERMLLVHPQGWAGRAGWKSSSCRGFGQTLREAFNFQAHQPRGFCEGQWKGVSWPRVVLCWPIIELRFTKPCKSSAGSASAPTEHIWHHRSRSAGKPRCFYFLFDSFYKHFVFCYCIAEPLL